MIFSFRISRPNLIGLAAATLFAASATVAAADPAFQSTSNVGAWEVATNVGGVDGVFASFPTTGFTAAAATSRSTADLTWLANNASGTNGGIGTWTFFVFRQSFDLAGFDASTARLEFRWAADDSGEGFADRGTWTPKYRLNGGALVPGSWATGATYDLGLPTVLSSGFVNGVNTLEFFVEGNGVTDGFALRTTSFTAAVPEPGTYAMLLAGLGVLGVAARRRACRGR